MNTEEDARGSGDNQTERDGEEGVEHLQPEGTMAVVVVEFLCRRPSYKSFKVAE